MSGFVYEEEDQDEAYDKWRQEQVDNEYRYPDTDVLIARGKHSTLSSERRAALKKLRDDMEAIAGYASRILRSVEDREFAGDQFGHAEGRFSRAKEMLVEIAELDTQIKALRPAAWGNAKEQE